MNWRSDWVKTAMELELAAIGTKRRRKRKKIEKMMTKATRKRTMKTEKMMMNQTEKTLRRM